jgi:hypothetical protein
MEKAKYRVYIMYQMARVYVTTTRNKEDMIAQIREMHESSIHDYFKITRQISGDKEETVYTKKGKKNRSWESELYK